MGEGENVVLEAAVRVAVQQLVLRPGGGRGVPGRVLQRREETVRVQVGVGVRQGTVAAGCQLLRHSQLSQLISKAGPVPGSESA